MFQLRAFDMAQPAPAMIPITLLSPRLGVTRRMKGLAFLFHQKLVFFSAARFFDWERAHVRPQESWALLLTLNWFGSIIHSQSMQQYRKSNLWQHFQSTQGCSGGEAEWCLSFAQSRSLPVTLGIL